jgi:cellulose synthase (UDP-forming)
VDRLILTETFLHWSATHFYRLLGLMIPIAYLLFNIQAVHATVVDTLANFLPYFVVQMAAIAWLSESRALPIMGDLSHMLAATDIVKAVYQGLTKPTGQKFVVTAKGGDRSKRMVQTPLLAIFLTYLILTIAGVCRAFLFDPYRDLQTAASLPLFWSWYNILVLTLACLVCIEQPRFRKSERFNGRDRARLIVDGRTLEFPVEDISTGGMRLGGNSPVAVGVETTLVLGGESIRAVIVRAGANDFALAVEDGFAARAAMIRTVYSGRYSPEVEKIEPFQVVAGLARRVFR